MLKQPNILSGTCWSSPYNARCIGNHGSAFVVVSLVARTFCGGWLRNTEWGWGGGVVGYVRKGWSWCRYGAQQECYTFSWWKWVPCVVCRRFRQLRAIRRKHCSKVVRIVKGWLKLESTRNGYESGCGVSRLAENANGNLEGSSICAESQDDVFFVSVCFEIDVNLSSRLLHWHWWMNLLEFIKIG